ncbi:hypothetical protein JO972_08215 [Verrucomicrobiaceae bacterium 5K15]|uniref:Uncharacterized protein n=1 Tax=Oceaniferula flava TaxID=2800421 RepID=A0AAE2VBX7_9BACT|nr:ATP-grasp fold amidoligase family protein [Oceaniferula flavus]MBK1854940.1 hypothetical protein [Oceaniferula flavus]MBM1136246.1 hypothetical protein [Oceaniferula flavus]
MPLFWRKWKAKKKIMRRGRKLLGYNFNLQEPRTYCEKIQWLKLNHLAHDPKVVERADKYRVRKFLIEKGYEENLIPLLGVWERVEDIDWQQLPDQFVMKLNNASSKKYLWFVYDKSQADIPALQQEIQSRMSHNFGQRMGEFHYGKMPVKIIAETLLDEDGLPIKDYKFYCFHGNVEFLSIETGKIKGEHVRDYYTPDLSRSGITFKYEMPPPDEPFEKPPNYQAMVHMAEQLSQGFPHMRVDLYNINGQIYFGELTYSPECGFTAWNPRELDDRYGQLINIDQITH